MELYPQSKLFAANTEENISEQQKRSENGQNTALLRDDLPGYHRPRQLLQGHGWPERPAHGGRVLAVHRASERLQGQRGLHQRERPLLQRDPQGRLAHSLIRSDELRHGDRQPGLHLPAAHQGHSQGREHTALHTQRAARLASDPAHVRLPHLLLFEDDGRRRQPRRDELRQIPRGHAARRRQARHLR